jgi:putative glutamine amidotransferase
MYRQGAAARPFWSLRLEELVRLDAFIAIPCDLQKVGDQKRYTVDTIPVDAVVRTTGAVPVLVPALGDALNLEVLLDRVDALFVPGGLTNVHPCHYGHQPSEKDCPFDPARDATTLPLIRAALARGLPTLMTCRGFQELNVALGGTLMREPEDLPEEQKHGTPESAQTEDERYRIRHGLNVVSGGKLRGIVREDRIQVNSLHSQLIDKLAPSLIAEATADDGSVEAVSVRDAKGFALAVVFHPEYWTERDEPSHAILRAFAAAVADYAARKSFAAAAE